MNALHELQQTFQKYVRDGDRAMERQIVDTANVDIVTRLDIYAGGYRARLLEALATEFPGLHALAGEDDFDTFGRAYIDAHPSTYFNLRWFGDRLADFLRDAFPDHPSLCEMAAFEWAMGLAFDAADVTSLPFETVAATPAEAWPELRFRLHPSVQRVDLQYDVAGYWKAVDGGGETAAPPARHTSALAWVIWRRDLRTYFRSLDADEAWAMDALIDGQSFAEICAGLCQWAATDAVALRAAGFLRNWVAEDMVAAIIESAAQPGEA